MKNTKVIATLMLVLLASLFLVGGQFVGAEPKIVLDNPNPEVRNGTEYTVSGTNPDGLSVLVDGKKPEIFEQIEVMVPLKKAPSNTSLLVEVFDEKDKKLESGTFIIENYNRIEIWGQVGNNVWRINGQKVTLDVACKAPKGWRTLIPIEPIASIGFGAKTHYDSDFGVLIIEYNGKTTEHRAAHENLAMFGETLYVNDRVYADAFGAKVDWDNDEKTYTIVKETHPEKIESDDFSIFHVANSNPSVSDKVEYKLIGDIPPGYKLLVNGERVTQTLKFRRTVQIGRAPSLTHVEVEVLDSDGNHVESKVIDIENIEILTTKYAINSTYNWVNDEMVILEPRPRILDNRSFLPAKVIADHFGSKINSYKNTVELEKNGIKLHYNIGQNGYQINEKKLIMDTKPINENGTIWLPIRFTAEAFGGSVNWIDEYFGVIEIFFEIHPEK